MEKLNSVSRYLMPSHPSKSSIQDNHSTFNRHYSETETGDCMGKRETVLVVITGLHSCSTFNITWTSKHTGPSAPVFMLHLGAIKSLTEMIWLSISQRILLVASHVYRRQHGESCWEKWLKPCGYWICWVEQIVYLLYHGSCNRSCKIKVSNYTRY